MKRVSIVWAISFIFALSIFALAQSAAAPSKQTSLINDVRIEQKLDEQVPLDLKFRDETGREVTLRDYFGTKPVILSLVYYQCPMLCTLVLNGLTESLADLRFNVGEEFSVVTVSIDPTETSELAAEKKTTYLRRYGRAGAATGWHFLTGDEAAIKQLAQAVGFRYQYDPQTRQFAHASGIMVLTPQGKVARYFYGIEYSPRDLRLGLVEASANKIGSPVDQVLLLCYHYDATTGKYTSVALNLMRGAGFVTVIILGTIIFALARASKKRTGSGSFTTTKMN
ncbi:MAG TPA: SCO family protein [Blastocatellia bacterium]